MRARAASTRPAETVAWRGPDTIPRDGMGSEHGMPAFPRLPSR